jgi:RsmE family RNA methyltransferase
MQSRRLWLPEILGVVPVAAVAGTDSAAIADPDGHDLIDDAVDTVLVGPEGGFLDEELALARRRVSLSANVLRVETAAVAAAIMLTLRNEVD